MLRVELTPTAFPTIVSLAVWLVRRVSHGTPELLLFANDVPYIKVASHIHTYYNSICACGRGTNISDDMPVCHMCMDGE